MEEFVEVNEISDFISYIRSIEWQDPWLIALISFHILITFTCFSTRNYGNFQVILFITLLGFVSDGALFTVYIFYGKHFMAFSTVLLVYFSENINEVAARNWAMFSRQQYFDSKGLFISVVFSIPILLNCMIMVGSWLYHSTQLMTNLKQAQLRQRLKEMNSRGELCETYKKSE